MRKVLWAVVAVVVSLGAHPVAQLGRASGLGQNVVRLSKYIISVSNGDRSAAFYQEAFGLRLMGNATQVPRAMPIPALVQQLTGVAAPAMFRATLFAIPGAADDFIFEHTEFTGPPRPSSQPRLQDPGASFLVLNVRDLAAAIAGVKRMGGTIATTDEKPVENNGNHAVFARDPDGAFIELIQPPQVPPAATAAGLRSLVLSSPRMAFIVADAEKAGAFYRDACGLTVRMPGAWNEDSRLAGLPGLPGSRVRSATVTVPGTSLSWQFYEYGGVPRTPHVRNVPDPGAAAVGFEVRDTAAALKALTTAGGTVLSAGGQAVEGRNLAFARDPSGVLLEVIQVAAR